MFEELNTLLKNFISFKTAAVVFIQLDYAFIWNTQILNMKQITLGLRLYCFSIKYFTTFVWNQSLLIQAWDILNPNVKYIQIKIIFSLKHRIFYLPQEALFSWLKKTQWIWRFESDPARLNRIRGYYEQIITNVEHVWRVLCPKSEHITANVGGKGSPKH